ncbi:MAG: hypothetical protein GX606_02125 [Elusimicrobia bacterium]|nr:hypothetical protein [Elusimicrobiota bacterium]
MKIVPLLLISFLASLPLHAEEITLSTYYPAPAGSYDSLRSSKMCIGDNCHNGTATANNNDLNVQGTIRSTNISATGAINGAGITATGTISGPTITATTLNATTGNFNSAIKIGNTNAACSAVTAGTVRYNAGKLEYCNGTTNTWTGALGGEAPAGTLCGFVDDSGTEVYTRCKGELCPDGYTLRKIAKIDGKWYRSCIKD